MQSRRRAYHKVGCDRVRRVMFSSSLRGQTIWVAAAALYLGGLGIAHAQQSATDAATQAAQSEEAPGSALPPIKVKPPVQRQAKQPSKKNTAAQTAETAPNATEQTGASGTGGNAQSPSQQVPALGKTGTKLADLPMSVQVIPREVLSEQGATTLSQSVTNASGINVGGQDTLGYFDHFLIRGLNAQIYNDGFSDGDQLGGISHSLNGVKRIEILEGPGSALFGSGPPGGTINVTHYEPSSTLHEPSSTLRYGDSLQVGSFGTVTNSFFVTGPSSVKGLDYKVDGTFSRSDGFRDLASKDYEIRPEFRWNLGNHTVDFAVDVRHIEQTPNSYGLIYFNGTPIKNVPIDAKYSTPFAFANSDYVRSTLSDKWDVTDYLTVNNRLSYLYRSLDAERNGEQHQNDGVFESGNAKRPGNREGLCA